MRTWKTSAVRVLLASLLSIGIAYIAGRAAVRFGYVDNRSSFNEPAIATARPAVRSASFFFEDRYDEHDRRRNAFVGVAISGGGSRAAVFAAEALSQLHSLGFLDHATAISSVSGGSLAAAYYALSRRYPDRWPLSHFRRFAGYDYHRDLVKRQLSPFVLFRSLVTDYDRTDMLADVLDRTAFQQVTFGGLDGGRSPLPHLLINASRAGSNERFAFDDIGFAGIGSRLNTYRIARAVAASAAFPGLLNPSTFRDYAAGDFLFLDADVIDGRGIAKRVRTGDDALSVHLRQHFATRARPPQWLTGTLDSPTDADLRRMLADDLNWVVEDVVGGDDLSFVPDVLQSINPPAHERAPIELAADSTGGSTQRAAIRRLLTLGYRHELRALPPAYAHVYDGGPSDNLGWETLKDAIYAYAQHAPTGNASGCFVFMIDAHTERDRDATAFRSDLRAGANYVVDFGSVQDAVSTLLDQQRDRLLSELDDDWATGGVRQFPYAEETIGAGITRKRYCYVWRIGFDQILSLLNQHRSDAADWTEENRAVVDAHRTLQVLVNSVATDFRLVGPPSCTAGEIEKSLIDAARVLIVEDRKALNFAAAWFGDHFGTGRPLPPLSALYADARPVRLKAKAVDRRIDEAECSR